MPIRDRSLYPDDWQALRARRLIQAGHCCEGSPRYPDCRARNHAPHPVTGSRVVLTLAHLDHDPANNTAENLRLLCQRCHLTHDAQQHATNAAATREARRRRSQPDLFPET